MRNVMRRIVSSGLVWLLVSAVILVVDRYTKIWMLENLRYGESLYVTPFLNFTLTFNKGAAFSMLNSASGWQHYLLGGLAIATAVFIIVWLARTPKNEYWQNLSVSLILAGAIGNVWDRIAYGHVVDFVDFHIGAWHFAIFNVADSAICIGAGMLIVKWLFFSDSYE